MASAPADALCCRRPIPGGWTEQRIRFADRSWNLLLPANADAFLDELDALSQSGEEPDVYWARLWPTALTMSQLVANAGWPNGTAVLELGCGSGVVGLAALAAGCRVTFSDHVAVAVELALANATRNGFTSATGLVLDWKESCSKQFAAIIASDILYAPSQHSVLLSLLEQVLQPGCSAWIADPGRFHVSAFVQMARARGCHVEIRNEHDKPLTVPTAGEFQLLKIHRRGSTPTR